MYRQGIEMARKKDRAGAIEAYTTVIETPNVPRDLLAMALFNRGLVLVASGDTVKGGDDLAEISAMAEAPGRVKDLARQKLIRMNNRVQNT
jgi:hypothetical protein